MHKKIDVKWVWECCPGCEEPISGADWNAQGPVADFMIKDEKDRPMFRILRGLEVRLRGLRDGLARGWKEDRACSRLRFPDQHVGPCDREYLLILPLAS